MVSRRDEESGQETNSKRNRHARAEGFHRGTFSAVKFLEGMSMRAFAIRKGGNSFADAIICAADAADANAYVIDADKRCELIEIPPDIATAMGISEARGRYTGVLSKWIIGSA